MKLVNKTINETINKTTKENLTINLSNFKPNKAHLELLDKGLSFIPKPRHIATRIILENSRKLTRSMSIKYKFRTSTRPFNPKIKTFKEKSKWTPEIQKFPKNIRNTITGIHRSTWETIRKREVTKRNNGDHLILHGRNNLTPEEKRAIVELKTRKDIIIKSADKGGATVILDKTAYIQEALRQLQNTNYYRELKAPIYTQNRPAIIRICNRMRIKGYIDIKQFQYLTGPEECRNRIFYLLPKIHKEKHKWPQQNMPEGRPIVSDINSESYRISEYIDYHINKLAHDQPSFLKNTYDFVEYIRNKPTEKEHLIVTGDVTSLYTNMNINRTVACVKRALAKSRNTVDIKMHRPDKEIIELLDLTLRNNDFEFNGRYFLQICGTAMGKKYAPALANLYLLDFDKAAMEGLITERGIIKPYLYKRYLDDIFFMWPGTTEELKLFEEKLGKITAGIKITMEYNKETINFLDTTIYKEQTTDDTAILKTRIFFKATDTHQLLHTKSFHPEHTTKGILKSQLIRFKRISSSKEDYDNTCKILFSTLKDRGYTRTNLRKQQKHVWFNHKEVNKEDKDKTKRETEKILPITVTHDEVGSELAKKYRNIIQESEFFKDYKIITAYQNHKSLRQELIRSRLN